jgi:anion-transporting  ArsA/GET3 family ATPase
MSHGLKRVLDTHQVIVSAGSGGVGKTTTAAAIGLYGAQQGRRTVVLTIDPARRLADALGIGELRGGEESEVKADFRGSLTVMMLDQKSAWDALVSRHAPSPEIRDRVLGNRFYQHLSQTFAGSQEYMAIEQLSELHASGRFDLIVIDTPPTRHALDFLEAPRRLGDFLDRQIVKWFVKPYFSAGWATAKVMNRTANFLLRHLEEATGVSVLVEVSDFFTSMSGLFDGFQERVQRVYQLLQAEETAFVLVASPEEQVLSEAEYFCRKVAELQMPLRAVVFNRAHFEFETGRGSRAAGEAGLEKILADPEAARRLLENFDRYEILARGDAVRMESFRRQLPRRLATVEVPNFDSDLHDISGLERMHPYLFGG